MDVLGDGRADDLLGRQPDALVDDLEAGVAGPDGHLLGPVGVPVEPRLADEDAQPLAELLAGRADEVTHPRQLGAARSDPDRAGDPRRRPELAEDLAQRAGPLPRRQPGARALERRRHEVGRPGGVLAQAGEGSLGPLAPLGVGVALLAPAPHRLDGGGLDPGVDGLDRGVEVGGQRVGLGRLEAVDADDDLLPRLDARPAARVRRDELGLHVAALDGRDRAAELGDPGHLLARPREQLLDLGLDDDRPLEEVRVLEQVGLVGEHLLDAQRPLLVPGPGQAEGLVPRRQLHRAGPRVLAQGDREHLEDDPLDVVLGLGLGEPQRVDLHPVAEAPLLGSCTP